MKLLYYAFTTINNRLDVYNIKVDNKLVVKLLFKIKVLLTLLKKLRFGGKYIIYYLGKIQLKAAVVAF